ncbi:hypothetical protein ACS2TZ_37495, partial [Bacillus cereus group sp. Bce025]
TSADQVKIVKSTRKFPPIEVIIDKENNKVNFDKIAELVSKDLRGGYIIESGIEHWNGFGLKRLMEYTENSSDISSKAQDLIYKRIINVMTDYWENYLDVNIPDDELPDLDIMQIFSDYTPNFDNVINDCKIPNNNGFKFPKNNR